MKKRISWTILLVIVSVGIYFHGLIGYGISQGKGQFNVLWNAQPITEVLEDSSILDSIKYKLELVNEIRSFAFDSLGLTPNENYTTFYDQHGKEILWVVTACNPYKFEPKEWSFPIVGSFTYKGYFDLEKAKNLAIQLKEEGLDVEMSSVRGWSTLGWFKDPVLSNMLEGSVGSLSNTLIHELTHGTLFIPDSMTFNENLASFIGGKGALEFLEQKYGRDTQEVADYSNRLDDRQQFTKYMVLSATLLDSIYKMSKDLSLEEKESAKKSFMKLFKANIDTINFINPERYRNLLREGDMNNASFISFLNYRERQHEFEIQLNNEFKGDISNFILSWKEQYPN